MNAELWPLIGWAYLLAVSTVAIVLSIRNAVWVRRMRDNAYDYNPPPWFDCAPAVRRVPPPLPTVDQRIGRVQSELDSIVAEVRGNWQPVGPAELIPEVPDLEVPANPCIRTSMGKFTAIGLVVLLSGCYATVTEHYSTDRGALVYIHSADGVSPTPAAYGLERCTAVSQCGTESLCCYDRHYNIRCIIRERP